MHCSRQYQPSVHQSPSIRMNQQGHCISVFQGNYKATFQSLHYSIDIVTEHTRNANIRIKEAHEKCKLFSDNLLQQKASYEAMHHQLNIVLAQAAKLNLFKVNFPLMH